MLKKIFDLWDKHTTGFCRVLFALMIPAAIFEWFNNFYVYFLLLLWVIVHTGYSKAWDKRSDNNAK